MLKAEAAQVTIVNCDAGSGLGGSRPTPQTKIFRHQCGGRLQPVGVKPPPPTNRTLLLGMDGTLMKQIYTSLGLGPIFNRRPNSHLSDQFLTIPFHSIPFILNQTTTVHKRTDKRQRVIKVQTDRQTDTHKQITY